MVEQVEMADRLKIKQKVDRDNQENLARIKEYFLYIDILFLLSISSSEFKKKIEKDKTNYPTGPVQFDAPPPMPYPGPHHYQNPFPEYPPVQENHIILDDDGLKTALAVQIEYYFSDANLQKGKQDLENIDLT